MTGLHGAALTGAFLAAWRAVRLLPEPAARAAFAAVADRAYARNGQGVRRLRENLAVASPEVDLDALTRAAVRSYFRYWCEAFRLPSWPLPDLVRRTRTVAEQPLRDAFARGPGAIIALPHCANWDWAGAWATETGMPVVAVAERLEPAKMYDAFVDYRRRIGLEIVPLGTEDVLGVLEQRLYDGRLVCLLADRDLSSSGVGVELLGRRARVPVGPAVLAQRTGAALVPLSLRYDGLALELSFAPPVPMQPGERGAAAMMQVVADVFTEGIRAQPEDWHMMQRVFSA